MINDKLTYGIILARGGSKTIKLKNLAVINGKSLLERAIDSVKKSQYIDKCFVSSDSNIILEEAQKFGAIPIVRPNEFAQDTSKSSDAIKHFLGVVDVKPHYIAEVMCTSPFRTFLDVDKCIEKIDSTVSDSVVAVTRVLDHHPSRLKYIEEDMLVNFFPEVKESRRQDLVPHAYVRCGSIYVFKYLSFLMYNSRYGGICRPYVMSSERAINVDEEFDLLLAQPIGEKYDF